MHELMMNSVEFVRKKDLAVISKSGGRFVNTDNTWGRQICQLAEFPSAWKVVTAVILLIHIVYLLTVQELVCSDIVAAETGFL